jgi:erythromycin esterase-like protein
VDRIRELFSGEGAAQLVERAGEISRPLEGVGDLNPLLERIGEARCVLLGEASHGTSEYYARGGLVSASA